jgi:hypothetical protein
MVSDPFPLEGLCHGDDNRRARLKAGIAKPRPELGKPNLRD